MIQGVILGQKGLMTTVKVMLKKIRSKMFSEVTTSLRRSFQDRISSPLSVIRLVSCASTSICTWSGDTAAAKSRHRLQVLDRAKASKQKV